MGVKIILYEFTYSIVFYSILYNNLVLFLISTEIFTKSPSKSIIKHVPSVSPCRKGKVDGSFDCFRFGFSVLFAVRGLGQCGTLRFYLFPVLCPVSVLDFRAGYASNLFTSVDGSVDVPNAHYARCKACDKQLDRT